MIKRPETQEEYEKLKANKNFTIIKYGAVWCGPCKSIKQEFEQLPTLYPNATFVDVDVEKIETDVKSLPTFRLLKDNKIQTEFAGANINKLIQQIEKHK